MKKLVIILVSFITLACFAQVETIPFEEDDLLFIKVKVNEGDELNFVFDTGASLVVLDSLVAKRMGIKSDYSQNAQGANGIQSYKIALNQKVGLGKIDLISNMVLVNLKPLSQKSGRNIDGIIGYDILKDFVTQFNFEEKNIKLYTKEDQIVDLSTYTKIPMKFDGTPIPQIDLKFTMLDGTQKTGNFLFDSGANLTVLFNTPYAEKHDLQNRLDKTIKAKARGLNKSTAFTRGSIKKIQFDNFEFLDLPIDIAKNKAGVSASEAYSGILGAKIINRFDMVLDYKRKLFYFKPNSGYKKPFVFPMSGLGIALIEGKVTVSYVIESSEAYKKGIREGDELLSINDYHGNDLKLWRTYFEEDQKEVSLKIRNRLGDINTVTILLKRLI
ncbi:aspartyl protease family protein [Aquimarina sediminis]|uniref:aspartyl protease family protein n=1 Tax=Aquimarina sediminis TaxID=2070536 RepID=UPI000CA079CC|nr:aspartyl protease family protein [Aquimarina sediminis]